MKNKIFLQVSSPNLANNIMFTENDVNGMLEPWKKLKMKLAQMGYDFVTTDNNPLSQCAFIIFLDSASVDGIVHAGSWPTRKIYQEATLAGMKDKMALFLWEPQSVRPTNYEPKTWEKFKYIFTWNDDLVDNKKFFKFILPIPENVPTYIPVAFNQKKLLVNITANKYSSKPHELYSMRRKTIEYFTKHCPDDFDLYGVRWNEPVTPWQRRFPFLVKKYASYKGKTNQKIETLSRYKFTLCYENMTNVKGLVTEKIFDALKARSVPIYWGADNIEEYVDKKVFVDRRTFASDKDLFQYIRNVSEKEYTQYLLAIEQYLKSEQYKKFLPEHFCDSILKVLNIS